ncbi:NfeD family protein [Gloeocapsa sp. PCC 73106]|uniref:NfeD family protein n=1 Tax=Gloeocapsa sp. PCC 73106 TaxID=102232 RepID=UPI0002ABC6FD|nr:NfeD family protein [Gloeocapsa sp. PCC 73106]ELR96857.1 membrane protein implicated in regulation of membrane protease activity [Gloeocapsa sp. PCC 73106]
MQNTTSLWLIAGAILCFAEFCIPTQFILFVLGFTALIVGFISMVLPSFAMQVVLWLFLSSLSVWLLQRWSTALVKPKMVGGDDLEGETITAIPAGKTGRVLYEGNSWQAKAADHTQEIAPQEKVYIVRREGNTLIVASEKMFKN